MQEVLDRQAAERHELAIRNALRMQRVARASALCDRLVAASLPQQRTSLDQGPDSKGGQVVSSDLTPTTRSQDGDRNGCGADGNA